MILVLLAINMSIFALYNYTDKDEMKKIYWYMLITSTIVSIFLLINTNTKPLSLEDVKYKVDQFLKDSR